MSSPLPVFAHTHDDHHYQETLMSGNSADGCHNEGFKRMHGHCMSKNKKERKEKEKRKGNQTLFCVSF